MNRGTDQLQSNLWKLALILGGISLAATLVWPTETLPPATPTPAPIAKVQQAGKPQPSATAAAPAGPTPQPAATPTPTSTREPKTPTPKFVQMFHIVQSGEMPLSIAAEYGVAVEELMAVNQIDNPSLLQIGEELLIPITVTATPVTPSPTPTRKVSPTPTPAPVYYMVEEGDMLIAIALEYDTSVAALMIANNISDPTSLQIGQQLLIPPEGEIPDVGPTLVHEVESGDTILQLAFIYGSTVEDIFEANPGVDPNALQIGQELLIPVTSPPANLIANPRLPRITTPDAPSPTLVTMQQEMINGVNAERAAQGFPPYQADEQLSVTALAHAQDMIARGYFSHYTPEGLSVRERLQQRGANLNWVGENIYLSVLPAESSVQAANGWFMGDAAHRNNILHSRYSRIGVGVAQGPTGYYTFVQVFAGD